MSDQSAQLIPYNELQQERGRMQAALINAQNILTQELARPTPASLAALQKAKSFTTDDYKQYIAQGLTPQIEYYQQQLANLDRAIQLAPSSQQVQPQQLVPRADIQQPPPPTTLPPKKSQKITTSQMQTPSNFTTELQQYEIPETPYPNGLLYTRRTGAEVHYTYDIRDAFERRLDRQLPQGSFRFTATVNVYATRADILGKLHSFKETIHISEPVKVTPSTRQELVQTMLNKLFTYTYTKEGGFLINAELDNIEFQVFPNNSTQQQLITVATTYKASNCVLDILQNDPLIDKVYKRLPHFRTYAIVDPQIEDFLSSMYQETYIAPEPLPQMFIDPEELQIVAATIKKKIVVFSKLGSVIDQPWRTFGLDHAKKIELVFGNGHANIRQKNIRISSIEYTDDIPHQDYSGRTDIIAYYATTIPHYAVILKDNKQIMYKSFRPSSVTNNPDDDQDIKYAYAVDKDNVLTRIFKETHNIQTISDPFVRSITKKAEHFISRQIYEPITDDTHEMDMNANYTAYKTSPYYMGFPTNDLYPAVESKDSLFYIVEDVKGPQAFHKLYMYETGQIVLPRPTIDWLRKYNATFTVLYTLTGNTTDIDITEFANKHYTDPIDQKRFRNSLVGRIITGGMNETRHITLEYTNPEERDQIIYEADQNNLKFELFPNQIRVHYKVKTTAAFHFHAFILSYAFTLIATPMHELQDITIKAINVDAIFYTFTTPTDPTLEQYPNGTKPGEWKRTPVKPFYMALEPNHSQQVHVLPEDISLFRTNKPRPVPFGLIGAPGIGKSYPFVSNPCYDQIILTPTCQLAHEHTENIKKLNSNTTAVTAEKYYQTNISQQKWLDLRIRDCIPRRRKIIVIDELTMFTKKQFDVMLERANYDGSIVILLFDPCQIRNEMSDPITLDFIKDKFYVCTLPRLPTTKARQPYSEGILLDSLRQLSPKDQIETISEYVTQISEDEIEMNLNHIHVTSTHVRAQQINALYKASGNPQIRVKQKKHGFQYIDTNSPLIWWGRTSVHDKLPPGFKYEPAFSVTADSLQGSTFHDIMYLEISLQRYGTFYTALTRVKTIEQIRLIV